MCEPVAIAPRVAEGGSGAGVPLGVGWEFTRGAGVGCEVGRSATMVGWSARVGVGWGGTEVERERTGGVPRRLGVWIVIRCVGDVWFCWAAVVIAAGLGVLVQRGVCPPSGCLCS